MKHLILLIAAIVTLAAEQQYHYTDAFDMDRTTACDKAMAMTQKIKNLEERTGCNCEKMDFDGWRCLVRYTLKNGADAAN